jgi:hypothetical protein
MAAEPAGPTRPTGSRRPALAGALGQAAAAEFSFEKSVGGVRGIIESVLPYTVFSLVYAGTKDIQTSIIAAGAPLAVLVVWRLIARETLVQAVSGVLGIAIGAYIANKTGKASYFFLPNILKNTGFAAAYAISILVRWPLIGVVVGPMTGEMFAWRDDRRRYTAYKWATWIWVGMFAVRLAVQIPLFLADQVTLLGTLNGLVLGIPLFALTIWLSWLVLRSVPLAKAAEVDAPELDDDDLTEAQRP